MTYDRAKLDPGKEGILVFGGKYVPCKDCTPTRFKQYVDEIMEFQKEFSALIYYQKDLDKLL